jgi:hypothetical protein
MNTHQTTCCFCRKQITVNECLPGDEGLMSELKTSGQFGRLVGILPENIACDPCAEYRRRRNDIIRAIYNAATKWAREPMVERHEIESAARRGIARLLNQLCSLYERQFKLRPIFEPSMVDTIIDSPTNARFVIKHITARTS